MKDCNRAKRVNWGSRAEGRERKSARASAPFRLPHAFFSLSSLAPQQTNTSFSPQTLRHLLQDKPAAAGSATQAALADAVAARDASAAAGSTAAAALDAVTAEALAAGAAAEAVAAGAPAAAPQAAPQAAAASLDSVYAGIAGAPAAAPAAGPAISLSDPNSIKVALDKQVELLASNPAVS